MFLRLEMLSSRASIETWSKSDVRESSGSSERINFDAAMEKRHRLELKTGEIFLNPADARGERAEKAIGAYLNVYPKPDAEDRPLGKLTYMKAYESRHGDDYEPARLFFELWVSRSEFDALWKHLLAGHAPTEVTLEFGFDDFSFGWEPDGSCVKWANEDRANLDIGSARFDFSFLEGATITSNLADELDDRDAYQDQARVSFALLKWLASFEKTVQTLLAIIAFGLALIFWRLNK